MPERTFDPALLDALEDLVHPWSGTVWRQVFAGSAPLRPNLRGARWNPPDVEALYCSLDAKGAAAELDHIAERQPIPIRKLRLTIELDVSLQRVVHLTDLELLAGIGFSKTELTGSDLATPQHVGHAVAWLGCGGLLVPSIRHPARNLVVYVNNMVPDDRLDPIDHVTPDAE